MSIYTYDIMAFITEIAPVIVLIVVATKTSKTTAAKDAYLRDRDLLENDI
jgi:hypothetical protein